MNQSEPRDALKYEIIRRECSSSLPARAVERKVKQIIETPINSEMAKDLSNSKISRVCVQANYEIDKNIQKIIRLIKDKKSSVISRLPPPWRERFCSFSLDSQNLLYMDQRLVIPKSLNKNVLRAIHFNQAGRDAMWWPRIHREIIEKAKKCADCQKAGEIFNDLRAKKNLENT